MKLIVPQPLITALAVITKDDLSLGPVQANLIEDWIALVEFKCVSPSPLSQNTISYFSKNILLSAFKC